MADAEEKSLEIKILTKYFGEGAAKALTDQQRLRDEQGKFISTAGGAKDATQELAGSTIKSAEAAEEAGLSHRELRKVLYEVGNVAAPGAGHALSELAFGPVGAALALATVFEMLRKKIEDVEKQEEDLNNEQLADHQKSIDALREAWIKTQKALGDYYAAMATAGTEKDPTKKQLENIKAVTDAQLQSSKEIIEALGKQEVAQLRASGASADKIADAEERTRLALAKIESQKEYASGTGGLLAEQKMRQAQDAELQRRAIQSRLAAEEAERLNKKNDNELAATNEALDPTKPSGKALKEKQETAAGKLEEANNAPDFITISSPEGGETQVDNRANKAKAVADAQQEVLAAAAEVDRLVALQTQLRAKVFILQENAKETATRATDAENESATNRGRIRELPGEINQSGRVQGVKDRGEQIVELINTRDQKTGETLGEMGAQLGLSNDQILKSIDRIINNQINVQQVMAGYEARIKWLEQHGARLANNSNVP